MASARERLVELLREPSGVFSDSRYGYEYFAPVRVRLIVEACAEVADEWTHSRSCEPDGRTCEHQRMGDSIATAIRAALKEASCGR